MDLLLVRHGKAESGSDDAARRLSGRGRHETVAMGRFLAGAVRGRPIRIEHSPLVRARETAEILAAALGTDLNVAEDLRPESDVHAVRERLEGEAPLMLVGHNPFMERLAALLLAEDAELTILTFHTASVAKLVSVDGSGRRFTCDWLVSPGIMRS